VKSDVAIVGLATSALVNGRDPYALVFDYGPLSTYPASTQSHYPYLPGSMVFGLAYAASPRLPLSDPRLSEALVTITVFLIALQSWEASARIKIRVFQLVLVSPLGAAFLSTSGKELPTLSLMFLSLVLLEKGEGRASGIAAGLAMSIFQLALPLLLFLPRKSDPRSSSRSAPLPWAIAVVAAVSFPFLVWHPLPFLSDTVLYPLGVGQPSGQTTFTPGGLLLRAWPSAIGFLSVGVVAVIVLVAFGLEMFSSMRGWSSSSVAARAGVLATVCVLAAPRSRIGYLAFPIDLLVLAYLLRRGSDDDTVADPFEPAPSEGWFILWRANLVAALGDGRRRIAGQKCRPISDA